MVNAPPIMVNVRSLDGNQLLELEAEPRWTVLELKTRIAQLRARTPVLCQRLVLGSAVLDDGVKLTTIREQRSVHTSTASGDEIELTLVISLDQIYGVLKGDRRNDLLPFYIEAFGAVSFPGDGSAITEVLGHLGSDQENVQLAAVQALGRLALQGDERVIRCLGDMCADVAAAAQPTPVHQMKMKAMVEAFSVLARIAIPGEWRFFLAIMPLLTNTNDAVRKAFWKALVAVAPPGDADLKQVMVAMMAERLPLQERLAALEVLAHVDTDGGITMQYVNTLQRHEELSMPQRCLFLRALPLVVERSGHAAVLNSAARAAVAALEQTNVYVREAAVEVLPELAQRGGQGVVVDKVIPLLGHDDPRIQATALRVIGRSAVARGGGQPVAIVARCLVHTDARVRQNAVQALGRLAPGPDFSVGISGDVGNSSSSISGASDSNNTNGSCSVIASLSARLEDEDALVRSVAVEALAEVCAFERVEAKATQEVLARLSHADLGVQEAALRALAKVARPGDAAAVEAVCCRLEHPDAASRQLAVELFPDVVGHGDKVSAELACQRLEHEDWQVAKAASKALSKLANHASRSDGSESSSCVAVMAALNPRLDHDDAGVRSLALKVMAAQLAASENLQACDLVGVVSIKRIEALVKDPNSRVRKYAKLAIANLPRSQE
eukprot:TRINITY_DN74239_c0_g1_i1.p1 TRINITY_DN74239_c0_g1~~TRINITY_DN74239_c0_g1_i1.p1  ORF type:complete len:705 (+),score=135.68 TRINITY_DN74239_c0_g1_i1:110-2116(+)